MLCYVKYIINLHDPINYIANKKTHIKNFMVTLKSLGSRITAQIFHLTQTSELISFVNVFVKVDNCPKIIYFQ